MRDICLEQPGFCKVTEMCVKMIRRVNDEEGIKVLIYSSAFICFCGLLNISSMKCNLLLQKLVNETFQKLWFTPTPSQDREAMTRKILNITDVVQTTSNRVK